MATEKGVERRLTKWRILIAERLKQALRMRDWNQVEFAEQSGMKVSFVNRVLQAEANLTLQTICKLEDTLGYDLISVPTNFEPFQASIAGNISGEVRAVNNQSKKEK